MLASAFYFVCEVIEMYLMISFTVGAGLALARKVGDERLKLLYQQLDDKYDEITKQAETISRLRQQIKEQDVVNNSLRIEREGQLKEITTLQSANRVNALAAAEKAAGNQQGGYMASQQQEISESIFMDDDDDEPAFTVGAGLALARKVGDEQLKLLYQQLDDKYDEINKQVQTIARLRQQIEEQDVVNNSLRIEREGQLKEITTLQCTPERVRSLELSLKEAKEGAIRAGHAPVSTAGDGRTAVTRPDIPKSS
ncbi:unnamed protein product [Trichobilharzia szidati]|nr:unnamed protein product [Trichobilharzia szidati]